MAEEKGPSLGCSGEASAFLQALQSRLGDTGLCSRGNRERQDSPETSLPLQFAGPTYSPGCILFIIPGSFPRTQSKTASDLDCWRISVSTAC